MILRKPTRIQLKPEEDSQEYEQFKFKLNEAGKSKKSNMDPFKNSSLGNPLGTIKLSRTSGQGRSPNLPQSFYRTPNSHNDDSGQISQGWNQRDTQANQLLYQSLMGSMNPQGMETPPERHHHI